MIITKTPYRISFFGGGTDLKEWYQENGGHILSTSINKYCNLIVRDINPCIPYNFRILWKEIEEIESVNKIKHPIVREAIKLFGMDRKLSIYHEGDLPGNSGIASSSAFSCGIVSALNSLNGTELSKKEVVQWAIKIEREILLESGGIQDQIATGYGGFNYIKIEQNGDFYVNPVNANPDLIKNLQSHLMLFYTGIQRFSSDVSVSKSNNLQNKKQDLTEMSKMPLMALQMLQNQNFEDFGKLLHETWLLKKGLSTKVSNDLIDDMYEVGMKNGALGGKLLGAGGGGFVLFFAKPENHEKIAKALENFYLINFEFENKGCHLANF